jgi:hypothetical protein
MPNVFTYDTANFPNGFNLKQFELDIVSSDITIALESLELSDTLVTVTFKTDLPTADKVVLDGNLPDPPPFGGLIAAHSGEAPEAPPSKVEINNFNVKDDQRLCVAQAPMTPETWAFWHGASDDLDSQERAAPGKEIWLDFSGPAEKYKILEFMEYHEIYDGEMFWTPPEYWTPRDRWSFFALIRQNNQPNHASKPAPCIEEAGGNCILSPMPGGGNIIVPVPDGFGTHRIDLTIARPAPALDPEELAAAFWQIDLTYKDHTITPAIDGENNPTGNAILFYDVGWRFMVMKNMPCGSPRGVFMIDSTQTEPMHKNWQMVLWVKKNSDRPGQLGAWIKDFRKTVTEVDMGTPIAGSPEEG